MDFLDLHAGFDDPPYEHGPLPPDDLPYEPDMPLGDDPSVTLNGEDAPGILGILGGQQDPSYLGATGHWHLATDSPALDSNQNGVSDAVETALGLDPAAIGNDAVSAAGFEGLDADGDGWPNWVEEALGTNPNDPFSHPTLTEAHHYPAESGENLPGSYDVHLPPMP